MAAKSKSGSSETPTKVSPATSRVSSKLSSSRGPAKPEPGSPSLLKGTPDRSPRSSLRTNPTVDRTSSKPEPASTSPLGAARYSADRSLRASLKSKLAIDQGSPKAEHGSPSPLQGTRRSDDRSPRSSLSSKPEWRSPKSATPSEKPQTRVGKGSELHARLNSAQEDLKKAKEQISLIEKEKAQAVEELKEANEKLKEAFTAQKRAEESSEIEKFRVIELEQAGTEAAQKKDEELRKEIESARNQHASDVAALCSTTQELERAKQELATACDAKNQALIRADDATKTAEIHAEKVETLSAELVRLRSLVDSEANENKEAIESLKKRLDKAKTYEEKFIENEAFIEQLNVDLEAARIAETYTNKVVEEWKNRVEELEMQIDEAKKLERSASESLDSITKQLESTNKSLLDVESENVALEEKVGLMEMTISKQIMDLVKSEHCVHMAKVEATEMAKSIESLKSELEMVKEEKTRALDNEKLAASSVQTLLEEKTELVDELEKSRDEIEKRASAIYQVSTEAKDAKEKLLSSEKERRNYETMLEDLRSFMKATIEKYETMLGDAKNEVALLTSTIEKSKIEYHNSRTEWKQQELHLADRVKELEEENSSREQEISRLANLLKRYEEEAYASKEEEARLKESLKEVESEVIYMQEAFKEVETESMKLKASLVDKETELQSVVQENEELRARQSEENGEPTISDKDNDILPKVVEFSEENAKLELPSEQPEHHPRKGNSKDEVLQADGAKVENANGQQVKQVDETKGNKDDSDKVELKMWEPELKSFVQEVESKVEVSKGLTDQINGSTKTIEDSGNSSPKQQQQKKKNALLRKFASLLKKKKKGRYNEISH